MDVESGESNAGEAVARAGTDPSDLVLAHTLLGPPDGDHVLFLHGITGSHRYFLKKVRRYASRWRMLLPDLPGFGESAKPHTQYTLHLYRDTVRNTIEHAGFHHQPLHIVAHSLGALIALEYAASFPRHVSLMALLNIPRFENAQAAHEYFWKGSPNYRRLLNEHSMSENIAQWRRTGLAMAMQYIFHFPFSVIRDSRKFTLNSLTSTLEHCLLNYRVDAVLERVPPCPMLLLHGGRDQVAPVDNIRVLPRRYPYMRLEVIEDSGHHIFLTHTRLCLRWIEEHLEGTRESVPRRLPRTPGRFGEAI
ncbi:MAG: alpha/beta fold hydrolase [Acidobacteriota bacterium]